MKEEAVPVAKWLKENAGLEAKEDALIKGAKVFNQKLKDRQNQRRLFFSGKEECCG